MDDADYALLTIGSMTGAAREAIDLARGDGKRVGLLRLKTFRPFPVRALDEALGSVRALGVVDRAVNYGWNTGPVYQEALAALYARGRRVPVVSFIGGLSGADLTVEEHFKRVIDITERASRGDVESQTVWLNENG